MVRLMIIADDFTGALDTGVHFAENGIRTKVIVSVDSGKSWADMLYGEQTEVLVIDAETRHVSKETAYRTVYDIVAEGKKAGISWIYKKTDSALRGNIGSELEAAYAAFGEPFLVFVPALPQMRRTTEGGKQYIDGVLVSQSVFGKDPFEPVTKDSVREIIGLQSSVTVREVADPEQEDWQEKGILVFDAKTTEDIQKIGGCLAASAKCHLLAGCAGFALILPKLLGLECGTLPEAKLEERLFVICGSVNPITQRQLDIGEEAGYPRICMTPEEKLNPAFWESWEGEAIVEELIQKGGEHACVMFDSNDRIGMPKTLDYAREKGMDIGQVRCKIAETLGIVLKKVLDRGLDAVILVTGGDTLLGFMKELGPKQLQPVRQIRPGCVLSTLFYAGKEYHVITKSGGFGEETLLRELADELSDRR